MHCDPIPQILANLEYLIEISQRVEYTLSNSGKSLMPVLHEIASWGNSNEAKKIVSEMIK